jgi:hypothetical protein
MSGDVERELRRDIDAWHREVERRDSIIERQDRELAEMRESLSHVVRLLDTARYVARTTTGGDDANH